MKNIFITESQIKINTYQELGVGDEGFVYKFDDKTAIKVYHDRNLTKKKINKIKCFSSIIEPNFNFPKGFCFVKNNEAKDYIIRGENLPIVNKNFYNRDFDELGEIENNDLKKELLLKGARALRRIHNKGFLIGDLKGQNILIDKTNEPQFIDTGNYAYKNFDFDLPPSYIMNKYYNVFGNNCDISDVDKYLYALLSLEILLKNIDLSKIKDPLVFDLIIENLNLNKHSKEILRYIFSSSTNKPYIDEALNDYDGGPIIKKELRDNIKFMFGTR